jgi:5'-3' exonuclease
MGIPSYFKRLTDSIPGLVSPRVNEKISYLLFDFNCIVYGCLRSGALPPLDPENSEAWETALCEEVCEEVVRLWTVAGKPAHVFIAVDGVVPMAKIKQQRMRRFKSVWLAEQECLHGVRKRDEPRWDTNAITPGTAFMSRLGLRLQKLCAARKWVVSTSDEPGEGEHKVMEWLRTASSGTMEDGAVVVYGLDADLILLSAISQAFHLSEANPCYLFREAAEFGGRTDMKSYLYLSIDKLIGFLVKNGDRQQFLLDYIVGMSLLGNDFLPHGLLLKIRDGGHDIMLDLLRQFHTNGKNLVNPSTMTVSWGNFRDFIGMLAIDEDHTLFTALQKKKRTRPMNPRNDTERLMESVQKLPLDWFVEKEFLSADGNLLVNWRDVYDHHVPREASAEYQKGVQWILDYYIGRPVDLTWFYPWHLPPFWSNLVSAQVYVASTENSSILFSPIQPEEQLAMVLPMESWHLIRSRKLRRLPALLPQFWPSTFHFVSHGRLWMWECEADIPILTPGRLRSVELA